MFQMGVLCRCERYTILKLVSDWHCANVVRSRAENNESLLTHCIWNKQASKQTNKQANKQTNKRLDPHVSVSYSHRLIKTQIGHARDFAWYRGQRPSPARVILSHERVQIQASENLSQLRDKSSTLSRAWVVIVRHLDYILITRAGDGRWPRYQVKSLACPGCVYST